MPAGTLNISGRKFVVIPAAEYQKLKAKASRNDTAAKSAPRPKRRASRQERGDIAESLRALADPRRIPIDQLATELGFDPIKFRK